MTKAQRCVLLVVGEACQLQTLRRGLLLLGIDCLTARSAAEALTQLRASDGERIDLLLLDLTIAGTSGAQLIAQARAVRPGLPVLVITGLALSSEVMAIRAGGIPILRKPFTPDQLGLAIETLLTASQDKNKGDLR